MILLIDNYDSFVFNIEQFVKELSDEEVLCVRNDAITISEIQKLKPNFIILSPGPKHPADSGVCLDILAANLDIPILGICLGHQAIAYSNGGKIATLEKPMHGKTSSISISTDSAIFKNMPKNLEVMRYHSLFVEEASLPQDFRVIAKSLDDQIIMALEHKNKPIWGIQFHPESYFSEYGKKIIENFLNTKVAQKSVKTQNKNLTEFLIKLQDNESLDYDDYDKICKVIASQDYEELQLASLLVLISEKSLNPKSLGAFIRNILKYSRTFNDTSPMIDNCGTGGDGFKTINISTAGAFILASLGLKVAKHGNRAVSSASGSSDVLDFLGVKASDNMNRQKQLLQEQNLAFFHAPFFHSLVGEVKDIRARLGIRTVFNMLGPLLNPNLGLRYQIVGNYHEPVHKLMCETLQNLGRKKALVVRGMDGMDEISICDETKIYELKNGEILNYSISPEQFGFKRAFHTDIKGGSPQDNAKILLEILKGEDRSARRDIVVLNTMFALYTAEFVETPAAAKEMVEEAIDSQKAFNFYKDYIKNYNS